MTKRAPEDDLLQDMAKYARMHETVMAESPDSTWTIDRTRSRLNLLWSAVPASDFFFSSAWEASKDTTLEVDGKPCGTLAQPDVEKLMEMAHAAPFGRDGKTVLDDTVRLARAIDGARVKMTYMSKWSGKRVDDNPLDKVTHKNSFRNWCGMDLGSACNLYKLHVYPLGGHFAAHVDTPHGPKHVGSAILQLPTTYTGGRLVVEHQGEQRDVKAGATFAAWYTDCKHWVEKVESGHRIVLQYDLVVPPHTLTLEDAVEKKKAAEAVSSEKDDGSGEEEDEEDDEPTSLYPGYSTVYIRAAAEQLANMGTLIKEETTEKNVALLLQHRYLSEDGLSAETLKGMDALVYKSLREQRLNLLLVPLVFIATNPAGDERGTLGVSSIAPLPNDRRTVLYPGVGRHEDDALQLIERQDRAEHTGNESMDGHARYLAAAIVVLA